MDVVEGYPPNIDTIRMVFPVTKDTVFAYGDTIYCSYIPEGGLRPDLIYHESIHRRQQAGDPESWWNKYIVDRQFRFEQELEAYYEQWQWVRKYTNAKIAKMALEDFARAMTLPQYQFHVTFSEMETAIRKYGKTN
jgi:hypothetical protein